MSFAMRMRRARMSDLTRLYLSYVAWALRDVDVIKVRGKRCCVLVITDTDSVSPGRSEFYDVLSELRITRNKLARNRVMLRQILQVRSMSLIDAPCAHMITISTQLRLGWRQICFSSQELLRTLITQQRRAPNQWYVMSLHHMLQLFFFNACIL